MGRGKQLVAFLDCEERAVRQTGGQRDSFTSKARLSELSGPRPDGTHAAPSPLMVARLGRKSTRERTPPTSGVPGP